MSQCEYVHLVFVGGPFDGEQDVACGACPSCIRRPIISPTEDGMAVVEHDYHLSAHREDGAFVFTYEPLWTASKQGASHDE